MTNFSKLVHCTTDYDSVKHYPFNRPCEKHGALLAKKIAEVNLLEDNPIKCKIEKDGKPYIIDGQGRLFAAKTLGVPFYWETTVSDKPAVEQITQYNANSTSFKTDDYINLYAKSGNENFIRLKSYKEIKDIDLNFLIHNYFNSSIPTLKQGLCKIPKLSDEQIVDLSEIAELSVLYKSLCRARKVKSGRLQSTCKVISDFRKVNPSYSKDIVASWLKDVANGDTGTKNAMALFQKLRMV